MGKNTHSTTRVASLSRRSFLRAGKLASDPWSMFCSRLRRACAGSIVQRPAWQGHVRAYMVAEQSADIHHALALCRDYKVMLALDIPGSAALYHSGPVLLVAPGKGLSQCRPLDDGSGAWFVQPGCLMSTLADHGFRQFGAHADDETLAQRLLCMSGCSWPMGQTALSGVVYASVVLADGTRAGLGPFGQRNTKPLEGLRLQRLVSSLFQLLAGPLGQACSSAQQWPARYRLDALAPAPQFGINLAHLVLGQAGELFWVDWLVMHPLSYQQTRAPGPTAVDAGPALDAAVKQLFDPQGVFPVA